VIKRRSDYAKLVSHAREVWRQSQVYQEVKRNTRIPGKSGWFNCQTCGRDTEKICIDHIVPVGKQPTCYLDFGSWLVKLFCGSENLEGICSDCHKEKTKEERKKK
jgi:5-methylcytosine-specific restriction endonuclease McrA